jgi:hypothetical protein
MQLPGMEPCQEEITQRTAVIISSTPHVVQLPIITGTNQLPNPPINEGITTKNNINYPWGS